MYNWIKNDPAGFMFSTINSKKRSRMIRFAAVLKDEEVNPERLKKATEIACRCYPEFLHKSKNGAFWGYLERAKKLPKVLEETMRPAVLRRIGHDGYPEFEVLYYKRRISIEGNHILADGNGFLEFLKVLLAWYFILGGEEKSDFESIKRLNPPESFDYNRDAFKTPYYDYATSEKIPEQKRDNTYIIPKEYKPFPFCDYLFGLFNVDDIKEKAKQSGNTITEYLAAALILSIIKSAKTPIEKTILIAIPCNLRKHFETDSPRNFTNDVPITFDPKGRTDISFGEILSSITGRIKANDNPKFHLSFLNKAISLVENPVLCAIPFFVKHIGFYRIQKGTHKRDMTVMLSNLGAVNLPEALSSKLERFDFIAGDVRVYDLAMFCSVIALNGKINFCFNFSGEDTSIQKNFFKILCENGIPVRVESANDEVIATSEKSDNFKKCSVCGVELAEEYTICPLCKGKAEATNEKNVDVKTAVYPPKFETPKNKFFSFGKPNFSTERFKAYFNF